MAAHFVSRPEHRIARLRSAAAPVGDGRHRPFRWRVAAALLALAALALVASCDLIAGVDELVANEPCEAAGDCPEPSLCHRYLCDHGACVHEPLDADTNCDDGAGYRHCDVLGRCLCPAEGCANGAPCEQNSDCESWFCAEGTCTETPCGGACPGVCWQCSLATNNCEVLPLDDTASNTCPDGCDGNGNCQSCTNETLDPSETDQDCGGPKCPPCADGKACDVPSDCLSCLCEEGTCLPPACDNHDQDGCESDVDCGGPCGPTCAPGEKCKSKQDCAFHDCDNGICGEGG